MASRCSRCRHEKAYQCWRDETRGLCRSGKFVWEPRRKAWVLAIDEEAERKRRRDSRSLMGIGAICNLEEKAQRERWYSKEGLNVTWKGRMKNIPVFDGIKDQERGYKIAFDADYRKRRGLE